MKRLKLPSGSTGFFNERNEWICTGSQMGRKNVLPGDANQSCKLHLQRLKLLDGGYDSGGAYWGTPQTMWIAYTCHHVYSPVTHNVDLIPSLMVFARAGHRWEAKKAVREILPNARFYR